MPLSPLLADWLKARGHDAVHAIHLAMDRSTDSDTLDHASVLSQKFAAEFKGGSDKDAPERTRQMAGSKWRNFRLFIWNQDQPGD
jgi:hypothetical protein